jgi:hypothetical protein
MPGLPDEAGMRYAMGAKMKSAGDRIKHPRSKETV